MPRLTIGQQCWMVENVFKEYAKRSRCYQVCIILKRK